jgi:predicted enzyme related to lactoylglutathione lyase
VTCAATVYVSDLDPMRVFYQPGFGLELSEVVPGDYCVLESDAWTLSLVTVPEAVARTIHLGAPPVRREQTPVKLTFDVESIDAMRAVLPPLGGSVDPVRSEWEFRGFQHCDSVDPEGNVVQLRAMVASERPRAGTRASGA